jgi:hypothetical protein
VTKKNNKITGKNQKTIKSNARGNVPDASAGLVDRVSGPLQPGGTWLKGNSGSVETGRYSHLGQEIKRTIVCTFVTLIVLGALYYFIR